MKEWIKVNLRLKDKNLPQVQERVLFAETHKDFKGVWHKFIGQLDNDGYIDTGFNRKKITSGIYWTHLPDDPE